MCQRERPQDRQRQHPIIHLMPDLRDWPTHLDAVIAAPEHHVLLFENELVRVLDISIAPGHTVALHTHCWPGTLYLVQWSDCVRRDAVGTVLMDSRTSAEKPLEGAAFWSPAMPPHTLENVGTSMLRLISTELKTWAQTDPAA